MSVRGSNAIAYTAQTSAARPAPEMPIRPRKNNVVNIPEMGNPIILFGRGISMKTLVQILLVCVAMVAIVAVVVLNKVRLDSVSNQLAEQNALLNEVEERYNQLSVEMKAKVDICEVERYANTELGMQLPEKYQITIMGQPKDDKVTLGEESDNAQDIDSVEENN